MEVLHLAGLRKAFGGAPALDGVDLTIERGEVHALLGGNGSGKSTLIKILAGIYSADEGALRIQGAEHDLAQPWSPADARGTGLRFVHQDAGLFRDFTVAENLCASMGWETIGPQIRWRRVHKTARRALDDLGIAVSTHRLLASLSQPQQSMVAIARAVWDLRSSEHGILVLDEPSATLPDHEMHVLMDTVRRVTRLGHAVLYVSHRLEEILAIADRITVLRDGRVVGTTPRAETNKDALLEMIVGRPVGEVFVSASHQRGQKAPSLAVVDLVAPGVQGVTFEVAAGEVLGVAGLADAGGRELLEALFGLRPAKGQILVQGRPVRLGSPQAAVRAGVALVPADRLTSGIFQPMSILENVAIGSLHNYSRAGRIARRRLSVDSESELDQHRVRRAHSSALITSLSGGNQQKVVLARALRRRPEVLILDDPTQGVDVGAKADIWALIRRLTESGSSVVVHSTDYEELIDVADRVLVLRDGGVVADVAAADLDRQRLTELTYQPLTKLTSS